MLPVVVMVLDPKPLARKLLTFALPYVPAGKLVSWLPSPRKKPAVILPVVEIGLLANAAKLAATLALPYVDPIPVSCDPLPRK